MSEKLDLEGMPDQQLDRMFDNRTTDEVVADIVAAEPEKHGVTVAERLRRAKAEVVFDDTELAEEAAIRAVGGDPFEFMPGNRPRWTVEDGVVHDHLTDTKYDQTGQQQGMATLSSPVQTGDAAAPTISGEQYGKTETTGHVRPADGGTEEEICKHEPEPVADSGGIDIGPGDGEITGGVLGSDGKVYTHQEWQALQQEQCAHDFGEDPQDSTPCVKCGIYFAEWANS